jgi:lysozyme
MAGTGISGIDVSSHQGPVDWDAVSRNGQSFAFVRATLGAHSADSQFAGNWTRARAAGLLRGAYHFFWPLAPAVDQADHFVEVVGNLLPGDLPPVVDLEEAILQQNPQQDVWTTIPADNRLPMIVGWLATVEHALGVKPVIYSRQNFLENLLGDGIEELADHPLWIAHYTKAQKPRIPSAWTRWTFWQYTEDGAVGGVKGDVDQNRFNGTIEDLKSLARP